MDDLDVFSAAMELGTPEEREKYLHEACGDNKALRERIEALLRSSDKVSRFMEAPAPGIEGVPTLDQPLTERPGTVIGPYKLLQEIGHGGMGVVYMADQTEPVRRRVALKIIKPGMDTRQVIARFEAERQALAMMDHPNIAKVLDAGTTDSGRPYFVMELVKGVSITKFCDDKHLTPRERLELFVPVCQAIQHAHQKGIIHRDIKPSNLLVGEYDDRAVPRIIDFGVAKATEQHLTEKTMFTQLGQILGTIDYMSPEQAKLNELDIDTRSDIYSLGVLLYELLTGETPFDRKRLHAAAFDELLRIIREEEPPRPSLRLSTSESLPSIAANRHTEPKKLGTLVHGELDWIVMKALEKDRTRRYETANGFADDIQRYLDDEPVVACPPSVGYRFRKFAKRNTATIVTASLITIALILGLAGTSWQAVQATRARNEEAKQRIAAVIAQEEEALARNDAEASAERERQARREIRRHLYAADMNLAQQAWDDAHLSRARELLLRYLPNAEKEDLRKFEWYYLWRKCHPDVLTFHNQSPVLGMALSPDGTSLATGSKDQVVRLWNAGTGHVESALEGHSGPVNSVAFSPDGRILASGSYDHSVKLWNVRTGQLLTTLDGHERWVMCVTFSPDGKLLASASRDGTVRLWQVSDYQEHLTIPVKPFADWVSFAPDGEVLAVARRSFGIEVRDPHTGDLRAVLEGGDPQSAMFSPDGAVLASVCPDQIKLWDWKADRIKASVAAPSKAIMRVAFSPDSKTMASGGYDRTVRVWRVQDGSPIASYKGHSNWVTSLEFFPDGGRFASGSADGTTLVWDVTKQAQDDQLTTPSPVDCVAVSAQAQRVAAGLRGGELMLWDLASGRVVHTLEEAHNTNSRYNISDVSFSPDGSIVTSAIGEEIKLWQVSTGELAGTLKGHRVLIRSVAYSPGGKAIASSDSAGHINLWDVDTGRTTASLAGHTGMVHCLAFSPDGTLLASGGADSTVRLWETQSGRAIMTLRGHGEDVRCIAFSPDGERLASASQDHTVRLWRARSGKYEGVLKGHTDQVWTVTFSADGETMVTGGVDYTVRIWDAELLQLKTTLNRHARFVSSTAFFPDGKTLGSGGWNDSSLFLWRAATQTDVESVNKAAD